MQPRKILVVEDSDLLHRMYDVMLQGYDLVHAGDGREGLQRLAEQRDIDLVLLDLNMPNMSGLEFLAELKHDEALAAVPVVIISTEDDDADTRRGLEAGAAAYVKKPFRREDIVAVLARLGAS